MINRLSLLFFFFLSVTIVNANEGGVSGPSPADSIRVRWIDGKKFILHKVEPKETWILLAKKYKCDLQNLKDANTGVEELKIGQIINVPSGINNVSVAEPGTKVTEKKVVPSSNPSVNTDPAKNTKSSESKNTPVYYVVKQGETLYSISKRFGQTVEAIKSYNNLQENSVKLGQKLIVQYNSEIKSTPAATEKSVPPTNTVKEVQPATPPAPKEIKETKVEIKEEKANPVIDKPVKTAETAPKLVNNFERATKTVAPVKKGNGGKTLMQVTETGVATWIQDGQLNQDKYYGLHRTAPIGTIIKVTNRMNNQFVYVKIVGTLPDTGDNDNVIIKVSQAVKGKLNALDPLFQVELSYGTMQ